MENENSTFQFLEREVSEKYFADVDFLLRQGKHIQAYDAKLFEYIDDYYEELAEYYIHLFKIYLRQELNTYTNEKYYYLDFHEDDKGKFSGRSKELDVWNLLFGLLLVSLFYEKYFDVNQRVTQEELHKIIEHGTHSDSWKMHIFGDIKENYTPKEWVEADAKIQRTLKEFERLGWVVRNDKKEINFDILPSIDRLVKLYKNQIENIESVITYG